ncbi:MAG: amidohydrolase family protein [Acidobacteria bacterium]|nr:amidohydrolase family protein [Acidobacteriota bacterium]
MRYAAVLASIVLAAALAQQSGPQDVPTIENYEPKSTLVTPQHPTARAKYPFIDVHTHHRDTSRAALDRLVTDMDKLNLRIMVNSMPGGGSGAWVAKAAAEMKAYPAKRFATMTNIDFRGINDPDYPQRAAAQLEGDIRNGAAGLKIHKAFGMSLRDAQGRRIPVDDARFDPVFEVCAKYKIPVLIHTADPKPLFDPMDRFNERWLELRLHPNRGGRGDATWEQIIGEQHHLFEKHRNTIFIDAHMGWLANDLGRLGRLLDRLPNVYTEIGAITSELGRQPHFARKWFTQYQDRVLFGKDRWDPAEYNVYFRLLESDDDYFDPIRKYHGIWKLYGLHLPDEVLKKLYYKNALRIFPGLSAEGFPK